MGGGLIQRERQAPRLGGKFSPINGRVTVLLPNGEQKSRPLRRSGYVRIGRSGCPAITPSLQI